MAIQQITALAIRVLGAWWILTTTLNFLQPIMYSVKSIFGRESLGQMTGDIAASAFAIALFLAWAGVGLVLVLYAERIARKYVPANDSLAIHISWSIHDLQRLAFAWI